MLQENSDSLDALIREEKHRVAAEFIQEAWYSALHEGIEPSILAESGLVTILTKLNASDGEHVLEDLIDSLRGRFESGHFDAARSLQ